MDHHQYGCGATWVCWQIEVKLIFIVVRDVIHHVRHDAILIGHIGQERGGLTELRTYYTGPRDQYHHHESECDRPFLLRHPSLLAASVLRRPIETSQALVVPSALAETYTGA